VKLYLDEPGASQVHDLVRTADVVVTSVLAYAEARATFARRRRERVTTPAEHRAIVRQFEDDWLRVVAMSMGEELAREAGRLAERHGVRGADAVHLASFASLVARARDDDVRFSCADERLTRAAKSLG
jgi:predicted nucleic acid-binding protein